MPCQIPLAAAGAAPGPAPAAGLANQCADGQMAGMLHDASVAIARLCHTGLAHNWASWAARLSPNHQRPAHPQPLTACGVTSAPVQVRFMKGNVPQLEPRLPTGFAVLPSPGRAPDEAAGLFLADANVTVSAWAEGRWRDEWLGERLAAPEQPRFYLHLAPGRYELGARQPGSGAATCLFDVAGHGQPTLVSAYGTDAGNVRCMQTPGAAITDGRGR